jgi:hypothetical protein
LRKYDFAKYSDNFYTPCTFGTKRSGQYEYKVVTVALTFSYLF